jgi:hypothetical protein
LNGITGSGYAMQARVSPDGGSMAVHCVNYSGSVLHFFCSAARREGSYLAQDALVLDLITCQNGSLAAVMEEKLLMLGRPGPGLGVYDYGDIRWRTTGFPGASQR